MKPAFRMQKQEGRAIAGDISQFVRCQRKYRALYDTTNGRDQRNHPDIWDAYVNEEGLNISFILEAFQERADDFRPPRYRFVGHPTRATPRQGAARTLIYLALGTILNDDEELFRVSARAFARLKHPSLIALGKVKPEALGPLPSHVRTAAYVDQETVLGDAAIFITMGGMASVHEAVSAMVPMIVIPETPEQLITARKIEALGIGVHLPREQVTDARLVEIVGRILRDQRTYRDRLHALTATSHAVPPARLAQSYIAEYLNASST
jgi:MGT family glycosyltransferase